MKRLGWKEELFIFRHLTIPCFFWKLRGLKTCKKHGFNDQSWIDGHCFTCTKEARAKMPKGGCWVDIRSFKFPRSGWWMHKCPEVYFFFYFNVWMPLYAWRFKMIFAADHKVYIKDRLKPWKKPVDKGGLWF